MEYISVENLSFTYDKDPVLENISFNINSGEFIALTGENGTAKSTLVKTLIGILSPQTGSVKISNTNIHGEELKISYLPQQVSSFNSGFPSTVYEFVKSGLYRKHSWFKKITEQDKIAIQKSLEAVGMWHTKDYKIGILSGGQKQRIIIARILCSNSDLLILDEPTTGMDEITRKSFYNLLEEKINKEQCSIVMVTHDSIVVERFANKNIHLCKADSNFWCCNLERGNKK